MTGPILIDTDVLIDYLRGRQEAVTFVDSLTLPLLISAITVAELYAGVRDGSERQALDAFVQAFVVIPLTTHLAIQGGLHRRDYFRSHGVGLADALIAATAQQEQATLVTLNAKHFPMLMDVHVPYVKP